jgi:uncharacterized membrane protein YphA (DoxX/SURF4 family)
MATLSDKAKKLGLSQTHLNLLTIFRVLLGWHLLYEGVAKILTPGWTSAGFLSTSRWLFSGFFKWIAANPELTAFADFLNIWGLIFIGLGLILGIRVKIASIAGMILLSLYYLAHPPFIGTDFGVPVEGHYLIVNKTLLEIFALGVIAIFPSDAFFSFDRYLKNLKSKRQKTKSKMEEMPDNIEDSSERRLLYKRRELIKNLALFPLFGTFFYGAYKKNEWESVNAFTGASIKLSDSDLKDLQGELPKGRLGDLEISRLLLGCNLIGGWSHSRDLRYVSSLFKAYNTEKKVYETLELAEKAGINMMNIVTDQIPLLNKYKNISGGKMQSFTQVYPELDDMTTDIDKAIDLGTETIYIQGGWCDSFVQNGHVDFIGKTIDYIKSQGLLAGVGAHSIQVPIACEKAGINPDYYIKTLHHDRYWSAHPREHREEFTVDRKRYLDHNKFHDNMFDLFPEQTIEFMKTIDKPFIGFKVLAGGAIEPEDGFRYAFENGADFICVGMFDFQIVDDVNIATAVLNSLGERTRPWVS